ncbi:hypothetical protein PU629_18620 [Pullulanibacillus sp. KACC 23026]|nr:hypothetical protein [Pullulanibacillus sp. KACC 23026]WEG15039.1 hypothetical protein PU629_18620 [Pullulanibacillus sp. KACC 23026]
MGRASDIDDIILDTFGSLFGSTLINYLKNNQLKRRLMNAFDYN